MTVYFTEKYFFNSRGEYDCKVVYFIKKENAEKYAAENGLKVFAENATVKEYYGLQFADGRASWPFRERPRVQFNII